MPTRDRLEADPATDIVSALIRPANCKSADGRLFVGDLKVTGMEDGGWYWIDGPSGVPPPTGKPGLGYTGPRTLDGPFAMTDDELREHFARIATAQDRTDAQLAENAAQLKALVASQDRTDAQLKALAASQTGRPPNWRRPPPRWRRPTPS